MSGRCVPGSSSLYGESQAVVISFCKAYPGLDFAFPLISSIQPIRITCACHGYHTTVPVLTHMIIRSPRASSLSHLEVVILYSALVLAVDPCPLLAPTIFTRTQTSRTLLTLRHDVSYGNQNTTTTLQHNCLHSIRRHDQELELSTCPQNLHSRHEVMNRQRTLVLVRLLPLFSRQLLRADGDGRRALLAKVVNVELEAVARRQEHLLSEHATSQPEQVCLGVIEQDSIIVADAFPFRRSGRSSQWLVDDGGR